MIRDGEVGAEALPGWEGHGGRSFGRNVEFLLVGAWEAEIVATALREAVEGGASHARIAAEAGVPLAFVRQAGHPRSDLRYEPEWPNLLGWAAHRIPGFYPPSVPVLLAAAAHAFQKPHQIPIRKALLRTIVDYHREHDLPLRAFGLEALTAADGAAADRKSLLSGAGGGLPSRAVARHLGIEVQAVNMRRARGALLAVREHAGPWLYPAFQLTAGGVPEHLGRVLRRFRQTGPWGQLAFLLRREPTLGPGSVMDLVRAGERIEEILSLITADEERVAAAALPRDP